MKQNTTNQHHKETHKTEKGEGKSKTSHKWNETNITKPQSINKDKRKKGRATHQEVIRNKTEQPDKGTNETQEVREGQHI